MVPANCRAPPDVRLMLGKQFPTSTSLRQQGLATFPKYRLAPSLPLFASLPLLFFDPTLLASRCVSSPKSKRGEMLRSITPTAGSAPGVDAYTRGTE
mmetsp:Transcript_94698/g.207220  ORF Transcript_94698/g.207220 Transcript_94698/m.207220 type:complete len:97 (+) Transcript_94698:3041-3331(+)